MYKKGFLLGREDGLSSSAKAPPPTPAGKLAVDHFEIQRCVGSGNFSEVYLVSQHGTNEQFAMKIINKSQIQKLRKHNDVLMEKHCVLRLNDPGHPNIIKLHYTFKNDANLYLVYDFCSEGDMWDLVRHHGLVDMPVARFYIGQLLNAVEYIHSKGIVHRDLKAENLMIAEGGLLKVIDFGTAKDLQNPHIKAADNRTRSIANPRIFEHYVGSANFLPPEAIRNIQTDLRNDLWSLGCTIYQMLAGIPPFAGGSEYFTFRRVLDVDLSFPHGMPTLGADLVKQLLKVEPSERLGAEGGIQAIKRHAFFEGLDFDTLHQLPQPMPTLSSLCTKVIAHRYEDIASRHQNRLTGLSVGSTEWRMALERQASAEDARRSTEKDGKVGVGDQKATDSEPVSGSGDMFAYEKFLVGWFGLDTFSEAVEARDSVDATTRCDDVASVPLRSETVDILWRCDAMAFQRWREQQAGYWEKSYPQYIPKRKTDEIGESSSDEDELRGDKSKSITRIDECDEEEDEESERDEGNASGAAASSSDAALPGDASGCLDGDAKQ